MGTELERRGVTLSGSALWSAQLLIDDPALIKAVHLDYLRAGADVITTATYQASLKGFAAAGKSPEEAAHLIRLGVRLAAEARDEFWAEHVASGVQPPTGAPARARPLVGFSAGSYGACLCDGSEFTGVYAGSVSEEELAAWHLERLAPILGSPDFDLLCFETVPCLAEVRAICGLLSSHPQLAGVPAWVSVSCQDATTTCHGEAFAAEVVPVLYGTREVVGISVNCTAPQHISRLLGDAAAQIAQLARDAGEPARVPPALLCYPNSGEQWDGDHRCWVGESSGLSGPDAFAAAARKWVAAGARGVGGCCRTHGGHITALRGALLASV